MLNMLSSVFEWPIAVDNWETDYGAVLLSNFTHRWLYTYRKRFFSHASFLLHRSGSTWTLEDVLAKLNEKYGTQLLVNFFISTDDRNSNSYIIHVSVKLERKALPSFTLYCI